MKRFISMLLILSVCVTCFATTSFATSNSENSPEAFSAILETLKQTKEISLDNNGNYVLMSNNSMSNAIGYNSFVETIEACNLGVNEGFLSIDPTTLTTHTLISFSPETIAYAQSNLENSNPIENEIVPRNGAHGCSVQAYNLLNLCASNYSTLQNYYNHLFPAVGTDAVPSTISYWISLVKPNGAWDYKSRPVYAGGAPLCCYFSGNFNHVTPEYIGNFNYGYTGRFLFALEVLHGGSAVVAGGISKDQHDWPAIDAGYYSAF